MARLTPDEIAAEAAQRPRAAYFAFAAGILSLLGGIGSLLFSQSLPTDPEKVVDLLEAMQARVVENTAPHAASTRSRSSTSVITSSAGSAPRSSRRSARC